jgi:MoaA/NifB/PqqE/SkfB family radical SAM enzyme
MNKNTYCILAECGMSTQNNGGATICNQSRTLFQTDSKESMLLQDYSLEQVWNSGTRKEIQDDLNNGIRNPNCENCWAEEDAGKISQRMNYNRRYPDLKPLPDQPRIMIFKPGNTCNLACRHCNPMVSSVWIKDSWTVEIQPVSDQSYIDYAKRFATARDSFRDNNAGVWSTLNRWMPNIVFYDLYGAEPTLIAPLMNVLDEAARQGVAKDQEVHVNTNGTIWRDSYRETYSQFKKVSIGISLDAVGAQSDYMRYPSKWDNIYTNLTKYRALADEFPHIDVHISTTVSLLNIYYVDEIWDFLTKEGLRCEFNLLHQPEYINARIAPAAAKKQIEQKLRAFDPDQHLHHWVNQRDFVINFLNLEFDNSQEYFQKFWHFTTEYDKIRNESYAETFPESYAILVDTQGQ